MYMRNVCLRILTLALGLVAFVGGSSHLHGQQYVELIKFTNTWRFNQSGANLGTAWIPGTYDDTQAGWSGGPALLAVETSPLGGNYNEATFVPNTIPTRLSLFGSGGTNNGTNITYYFRTKFTNTLASLTGVELWATNLIDDGCVIWLNGTRVADVRLTNASVGYLTLANGGPTVEGQYDTRSIAANRLLPALNSVNTMAVEVHQSSTNSSDVAFAMKLVAIVSTPLTITTQPQSVIAAVGDTVDFSIGVSGGPVFYRWYRNDVFFPNGTNATLSFTAQQNVAGSFYCVVSNNVTPPQTSSVVTLTVVQDIFGSEVLSATVLESGATNIIQLQFSESVLNTPTALARDTNNYRVIISGTTNQFVPVTNAQITGVNILLRVATNNWVLGGSYYVLLNNIEDSRGNRIAPNTAVGVAWNYTTNMTQIADLWRYYDCGDPDFCDPNSAAVYANQAWAQTNFVPNPLTWGTGGGILVKESGIPTILCAGDSIGTTLNYQLMPTLFRRTFSLAPGFGASATLRLRFVVDDGMVLFLNGREIYRWNVAPNTTPGPPVTINSVAATNIDGAFCITNISVNVSNLLAGTNWLAAAVMQFGDGGGDTVFGLEMDGVFRRTSPTPSLAPTNLLRITERKVGNCREYSWPVSITHTSGFYGVHLLWSSNLQAGPNYLQGLKFPNHNQVTNQSNPYTNSLPPGSRLFRLGRE